ncbi:hypothetical protein D3C81_2234550 [compost metagenome]
MKANAAKIPVGLSASLYVRNIRPYMPTSVRIKPGEGSINTVLAVAVIAENASVRLSRK